jgi:hypothetical protein
MEESLRVKRKLQQIEQYQKLCKTGIKQAEKDLDFEQYKLLSNWISLLQLRKKSIEVYDEVS